MENSPARDVSQLRGVDFVQGVLAGAKALQHVAAGRIARMNPGTLIPIAAVGVDRVCQNAPARIHAPLDYRAPVPQLMRRLPEFVAFGESVMWASAGRQSALIDSEQKRA